MMATPLGLRGWRLFTRMASPFARLMLRQRAARGKEDWTRMNERLGVAGVARPEGRLVWVHGASVGESLSALPLIGKLREDATVLVTSGTVTSAALLGQRLPAGVLHQFVPLDSPGAVARFLDHWRPDAGLFIESDLWPNLILGAHARGVKLALVNARISAASAERWRWAKKSVGALLAAFDMVLAQDEDVAERFHSLGAHNVQVVGSLKADAPPLSCDLDFARKLTVGRATPKPHGPREPADWRQRSRFELDMLPSIDTFRFPPAEVPSNIHAD